MVLLLWCDSHQNFRQPIRSCIYLCEMEGRWDESSKQLWRCFRSFSFIFNLHKLCAFHQLNVIRKNASQGTGGERESETGELSQSGCEPVGAMRWGATVCFTEHKLMIVRRCWIAVCHRALVHPPVTADNKSGEAALPRKRFVWQIDTGSGYMRKHFFIAKDISAGKKERKKTNPSRYSYQLTPLQEIFAYRPAQLCTHNVWGVSLPSSLSQVWFAGSGETEPSHVARMCLMVLLCFYLSPHKSALLYLRTFSFPLPSAAVLIKKI